MGSICLHNVPETGAAKGLKFVPCRKILTHMASIVPARRHKGNLQKGTNLEIDRNSVSNGSDFVVYYRLGSQLVPKH
jgi:hypothetical protein